MKNYWYTLQFDDFKLNQLIPQGKERNMPGGGDFLILPGWWADAEKPTSCQDSIIAEK